MAPELAEVEEPTAVAPGEPMPGAPETEEPIWRRLPFDLTQVAMVAGGIAVLLAVGMAVRQMRARSGGEAAALDGGDLDDDEYFRKLGAQGADELDKPESEGTGESGARIDARGATDGSPAGGADAAQPKGGKQMQIEMDSATAAPSVGVGAVGGDIAQIVEELQQRVEQLERQVTAQTEELRVQRAAIARTQRAVRSMSRGGEEDGATEPAPRDPKKPSGPRVG